MDAKPTMPPVDATAPGAALPPEAAHYRLLIDAMPQYAMIIDARHRVLLANRAATDAPWPGRPLEESQASGGVLTERELHDPETDRWTLSSILPLPLHTADGAQLFLHTAQDITETKRSAARNLRHLQEQETLGRLLRRSILAPSVTDMFQGVLDDLLALPWLRIEAKGAIFVARPDDTLVMVAQAGLSEALLDTCREVPFGT